MPHRTSALAGGSKHWIKMKNRTHPAMSRVTPTNARSRGGYDWTKRFPWIVEAALKNRQKRFVIDGRGGDPSVEGIAAFDALHSGRHNEEVQLCAFDILMEGATICASCRSQCARPILNGYWRAAERAYSSIRLSVAK